MRRIAAGGALVLVSTLVATVGTVGPAAAAQVSCGQVITRTTVLQADVGPCPHDGIIVGANNVTLVLNGHRVFGTPSAGDGAGILIRGRTGVTVTSGTVTDFDGGVVIQGGSGNTVEQVTARHNIGASEGHPPAGGTEYGDGILILGSSNNRIRANVADDNGPFSGIGLVEIPDEDHPFPAAPTKGNLIQGNRVTNNTACREGPFCDNDGIRVEPAVGPNNVIEGNYVAKNGLDGISLFADADKNVVRGNTVVRNGFRGAVPGDGIRVFSSRNRIEGNTANDNAAGGVSVGFRTIIYPTQRSLPNNSTTGNPRGKGNDLFANRATGNKILDLWDSNPDCDNNDWRANIGQKAAPPCTRGIPGVFTP